jgi:hypothetical protein
MVEKQIRKAGTMGGAFRTSKPIRTVLELSNRLERDPALAEEMKSDPAGVIASIAASPLDTDVWIYRLVVGALGLAVLLAIGGSIYLAAMGDGSEGRKVPEVIVAIGSAAVGALAGLLAPSPVRKAD